VRGGINLVSQLSLEERERGVIAASTGNHGQSVAYAARLFGVKAIIVVPENANPGNVAAMQGMEQKSSFMAQITINPNCTVKCWLKSMVIAIFILVTSHCLLPVWPQKR